MNRTHSLAAGCKTLCVGPALAAAGTCLTVHGPAGGLSQRARLMLDTVVDIKNNRRTKGDGSRGGQTAALPPALATYARAVSIERVALRNLPWNKILTCDKVRTQAAWA